MTTGDFCGECDNDGQSQLYTVYFDIIFNQPFTSSQVITDSGQTDPSAVYVSSTPRHPGRRGEGRHLLRERGQRRSSTGRPRTPAGTSTRSRPQAQGPGTTLLGKIKVSGGSYSQTQEFYSLLYKDFLQPQRHQRRQRPVHGRRREGAHAGGRAAEPVRDLLRLGYLPLARRTAGHARPVGRLRPGAVAGQLLLGGQPPPAVGLPEPEQLRDGRRPRGRDHLRLLRVRRPRLQHQAGAGRHAQAGHHGQRRAARRGAGAAVRLPARGRHLRLLQRPRRRGHPAGGRHR